MSPKTILIRLTHLLIHSDGNVNLKEINLCKQMRQTEGISEQDHEREVAMLEMNDYATGLDQTVQALKVLDRKNQVRCLAWLCLIANADGFMDKKEWHFIYHLYHKELHLPMEEVMAAQRAIFGEMRSKASPRLLAVL